MDRREALGGNRSVSGTLVAVYDNRDRAEQKVPLLSVHTCIQCEVSGGFRTPRSSNRVIAMKRYYCTWEEDDIKGLHSISEVASLYTESNEEGVVLREIGLNKVGQIAHRYPSSTHLFGHHGILDNQKVELSDTNTHLTKAEFEVLWSTT